MQINKQRQLPLNLLHRPRHQSKFRHFSKFLMQVTRPLKKLHLNILKPRIHPRQRLSMFRIPSLRRLCRCGRAPIPLPGFEELLDLLRVQFAVLILVRIGKTLEYSRQLLFGGLLR